MVSILLESASQRKLLSDIKTGNNFPAEKDAYQVMIVFLSN